MKTHRLPKGAKRIDPPLTKEVGNWVAMEYDAEFDWFGIRWLRAKGGFSDNGDREDWVADIPGVNISVHDYHWGGSSFGPNRGSFLGAIEAETKAALQMTVNRAKEFRDKASEMAAATLTIRAALERKAK